MGVPARLLRGGLILALLAVAPMAGAQDGTIASAPRITLITFGPGPLYWERFGHNALLVEEPTGAVHFYNFGIFDFAQKNFFLNFARGRMRYRLADQRWPGALDYYVSEDRWAFAQTLNFAPLQARELASNLAANARPENAEYRYDYFTANCSTRVRDAIDSASGGALRRSIEGQPTGASHRFDATRLMAPQWPLALGMDLLLGPRADVPLDRWQRGFVPMELMKAVDSVRFDNGDGNARPLVARQWWIMRSSAWPEPRHAPRWTGPALLIGVASALLMLLLWWRQMRRPLALLAAGFSLLSGLLGGLLLCGWLLTEHQVMVANRNLLLLSPLSLLLLPACFALRRTQAGVKRRGANLALLIFLAAMVSLPLLAQAQAQPNLAWIALLLPSHGALAWILRRAAQQTPDDTR